ncbi:Methyltransferase-like protein [Thalictrum thalictroides]|uniref:Methyltransferase-like protein n=1 Tax=Thalictrum thalictroides TaxID=46969 RepID=A0A7J6WGX3_THATH|nr:Methyltransferase-like protein [Thalictrum thalictroides]
MVEPNIAEEKELSSFFRSGIYREPNSNTIFIDSVRLLNRSYTRFSVSPSQYYSRFFELNRNEEKTRVSSSSTKSNRRKRKFHELNEREQSADQRHKEARPLLLRAHEALLGAKDVMSVLCNLRKNCCCSSIQTQSSVPSFIDLGSVWQAPMYEISMHFHSTSTLMTTSGGLVYLVM